jgi:ATP-dependent RNA helicase MSS116, mitochondrial
MALLPDHQFISTVSDTDDSTHSHVTQSYFLVSRQLHFAVVAAYISSHSGAVPQPKVVVFLPTAREAALYGQLFEALLAPAALQVFQIHSRLSQSARTRATEGFRNADRAVMFASDVIARGIDIQGITSVVQVGVPANAEQCKSNLCLKQNCTSLNSVVALIDVHRLGRTARAGESGEGLLILDLSEVFFVLKLNREAGATVASAAVDTFPAPVLTEWQDKVDAALDGINNDIKGQAYAVSLSN